MKCDTPDFIFPMLADVYYPIITQGGYGEIKKEWVFDRTIVCNASPINGSNSDKEEVSPAVFLQYDDKLSARSKSDIRYLKNGSKDALTNIIVTNIRLSNGEVVYKETAGSRAGSSTIYEVATHKPFTGPFGHIEYYTMVWRRTENQSVGD